MSDDNGYSLTSSGSSSLISSSSGIAGNISTDISNCYTPYYGYSYITTPSIPYSAHYYEIQLRKIENGWIMYNKGKEIFLKSLDEVAKFYNKEEKTK